MDHLLIHYKFAHALWRVFFVFGIQWVMPKMVVSLPFCMEELVWEIPVRYLKYVPGFEHVLCGYFGRNTLRFERNERPLDLFKFLLFGTLF